MCVANSYFSFYRELEELSPSGCLFWELDDDKLCECRATIRVPCDNSGDVPILCESLKDTRLIFIKKTNRPFEVRSTQKIGESDVTDVMIHCQTLPILGTCQYPSSIL